MLKGGTFLEIKLDIERGVFIVRTSLVEVRKWWNSLSNLDKEHIVALGYLYSIYIPIIVTILALMVIKNNPVKLINWITLFCVVITTTIFSTIVIRRFIHDAKRLRFMVAFAEFLTVLGSLLCMTAWLYFSTTLMLYLLNSNSTMNPLKLLAEIFDDFQKIGLSVTSLSFLIGGSFLLNLFLPKKLNTLNIGLKLRFKRFSLKMLYIVVFAVALFLLFNVNKDNFIIVATCYTALMWWGSPEKILPVFTNVKVEKISYVVKQRFLMGRWILTQVFISWMVSVYLFSKDKYMQVIEFEVLTTIMIVVTVVIKILVLNEKGLFARWLKDEFKSDEGK